MEARRSADFETGLRNWARMRSNVNEEDDGGGIELISIAGSSMRRPPPSSLTTIAAINNNEDAVQQINEVFGVENLLASMRNSIQVASSLFDEFPSNDSIISTPPPPPPPPHYATRNPFAAQILNHTTNDFLMPLQTMDDNFNPYQLEYAERVNRQLASTTTRFRTTSL